MQNLSLLQNLEENLMKFASILNCIYLKSSLLEALTFELVELIRCRTSVLSNEIQSIKTSQDRSGSLSLLQANKCDQNLNRSVVEWIERLLLKR